MGTIYFQDDTVFHWKATIASTIARHTREEKKDKEESQTNQRSALGTPRSETSTSSNYDEHTQKEGRSSLESTKHFKPQRRKRLLGTPNEDHSFDGTTLQF
jgi:hypothetical protein